jgi:hypothetical protein
LVEDVWVLRRKIFGPKRDEVTAEWRRLHDEEIYTLDFSPNIIRVNPSRRMRWAGHVAHMRERCIHDFSSKCGGLLGRPRRICNNNTKMDLAQDTDM